MRYIALAIILTLGACAYPYVYGTYGGVQIQLTKPPSKQP